MTSDIIWPDKYVPGMTDNFVSNETIVLGLSSTDIWPLLNDITKWESYYDNVADITPPTSGPKLNKGDTFTFSTFGFPPLPALVEESVPPTSKSAGRLAWSAKSADGTKEDQRIDVYHAWVIEDLEGGRVRILTQESQLGKPAEEMSEAKPNKMLNGHQNWLDGLVNTAKDAKRR